MAALQKETEKEQATNELEDVLAYHGGDGLAAVQSLLNDCWNIRRQRTVLNSLLTTVYTSDWNPTCD